jgi:hypothetical protein
MQLDKKLITKYYLAMTLLYIICILSLPFGLWNVTPIFYIFLGPVTMGLAYFRIVTKLNEYVNNNYPDLMKKYSLHYGIRKGEALNPMDALQNKKEFYAKKDTKLNDLLTLFGHSLKFAIIAFLSLIVITIVGMEIQFS